MNAEALDRSRIRAARSENAQRSFAWLGRNRRLSKDYESSHPPEWDGGLLSCFGGAETWLLAELTESVLHQLFGALIGNLGKWMGGENIAGRGARSGQG